MSESPYNASLRFIEDGKVIYINGNQIVRLEIQPHRVSIHLSDGSNYKLEGAAADEFIVKIEAVLEVDQELRYKPEHLPKEPERGLPDSLLRHEERQ